MRDKIIQFVYEKNTIISLIITCLIFVFYNEFLFHLFLDDESRISILEMVLSLSGTLFGFILTFLSIFLVFKTDENYKKSKEEDIKKIDFLKLFINNPTFNEVYFIFMRCSYFIGLLMLLSIIFYFTNNSCVYFIYALVELFIFLLLKCIFYIFFSLHIFGNIIDIIVKNS